MIPALPCNQSGLLYLYRSGLLITLLVLAGAVQAQEFFDSNDSAAVMTIGTVSGQLDTQDAFSPFSTYLEEQMPGTQFRVTGFPTIEALMTAIRERNLDFAFISPAAYVELTLEQDLRVLSTITQSAGNTISPWLAGAVFTRQSNTDINTLEDVQGKQVVALSEIALGGWLSAVREWHDLDINPPGDFATLKFMFSYKAVVDAVCSSAADVGVIAANTLPIFQTQCSDPLKILPPPRNEQGIIYPLPYSTRLYPEVAFAMIGNHDEEFIKQLTRALLEIDNNSPIARAVNVSGFTAPLVYTEVQELLRELRLGPYDSLSQLTLRQLLLDNIYSLTLAMLVILALIFAGFINAHRHSRRFQESETYRKLVFEGSHIPMVIVDPETNTFLDMNPAAVWQYGYSKKEQLINMSMHELTAPQQDIDTSIEQAFLQTHREVMETGTTTFSWRHVRPNGEEWTARIQLMLFDSPKGKLIQATVQDISQQKIQEEERRKLEQQLEFSQRMESIGRLAGGIAHDFNNLLTIINGYCEVLIMEHANSQSENILMQIRKAGIRASELTQQLLTFSRRQAIRQIPVDVNRAIQDASEIVRSVLGENIRLKLNLDDTVRHVLSDPGQLQQVLINLVVNAKDAMPDGGTLSISTSESFISLRKARTLAIAAGHYVEITMTDTGTGMSPAILKHIFEPFFTTKDNFGTGLGLSTVYGIVQQSLGTILVSSQEGEGTTFQVLLPCTIEKEISNKEEKVPLPVANVEAFNILVVEDQVEVLNYVTSVLVKAGYKVFTASSGQEALELLQALDEPIHLLITDVVMEDMSGGELAKIFNQDYPDIPVLFISGYPGDELARYGVREGAREFLAKPFSPKELLLRLEQILKSSAVLS